MSLFDIDEALTSREKRRGQGKEEDRLKQAQLDKIKKSHMDLAGQFKGLGSVNDFNMLDDATSPNLIENDN